MSRMLHRVPLPPFGKLTDHRLLRIWRDELVMLSEIARRTPVELYLNRPLAARYGARK